MRRLAPIFILFLIGSFAVQANSWTETMQKLSRSLGNAFPFLYSHSEFLEEENKKSITDALTEFANTSHTLPKQTGQAFIGAEPLIDNAQLDMRNDFQQALKLYNNHEFAESQRLVHKAVQKCFACHSAHQVGPQFPQTNIEVMAMPTPFMSQKAVVFGALRQFDGALKFIETKGFSSINLKHPEQDEMVKIYLVISLRTLGKFDRAIQFLQKLKKVSPVSSRLEIDEWIHDIKFWSKLKNIHDKKSVDAFLASRKTQPSTSRFVMNLFETAVLHSQMAGAVDSDSKKAEIYFNLGQDYEALELGVLSDLPKIYYAACLKASPNGARALECKKKSTAIVN